MFPSFKLILVCLTFWCSISVGAYKIPTIIEGTIAASGQFPWIVFIETPTDLPCVGTIIHSRHILTSAQCVLDGEGKLWNPFWFKIVAGALDLYNLNPRIVTSKVIAIYVHESYNILTQENDLAILRVKKDFPDPHNTIEVAEIYPSEVPYRTICQFAGWSLYKIPSKQTVQQYFYGSYIQDWSVCESNKTLANSICARSVRRSNSCQGNKGAGLFCDRKLVAVFSYGQSCNSTVVPSVYTDVRNFTSWMKVQISRRDIPTSGTSILSN